MLIGMGVVLLGYACGSLASAVLVCRLMGLPDPREGGSGNPGATNVLRLGGKKAAALTLAGDLLKGVAPVLVARALGAAPEAVAGCALAAFLGHLYPVFFRFRGGKGVATAFGAVSALAWPVALAMGVTWLAVAALTRYSSLSALCAGVLAPLFAAWISGDLAQMGALAVMSVLLVWRHRANVRRLIAGTEPKIGARA